MLSIRKAFVLKHPHAFVIESQDLRARMAALYEATGDEEYNLGLDQLSCPSSSVYKGMRIRSINRTVVGRGGSHSKTDISDDLSVCCD
jgi:hypothetical protein